MAENKVAYEISVQGVVQGVGFRYFTRKEALRVGVQGTVENESDGGVKIYVEGEPTLVLEFLAWCHKGPETATVVELDYSSTQVRAVNSFEIIR